MENYIYYSGKKFVEDTLRNTLTQLVGISVSDGRAYVVTAWKECVWETIHRRDRSVPDERKLQARLEASVLLLNLEDAIVGDEVYPSAASGEFRVEGTVLDYHIDKGYLRFVYTGYSWRRVL